MARDMPVINVFVGFPGVNPPPGMPKEKNKEKNRDKNKEKKRFTISDMLRNMQEEEKIKNLQEINKGIGQLPTSGPAGV